MKKDWEIKKMHQLSPHKDAIVGGPFGSNLKVSDYKDTGIPILRLQNIGKGYFIDKDIKYINFAKAEELKYHSFQAGDIALAKLGVPIGKTCIIPDKFKTGIVVADVVRIRPDKKIMDYDYLVYYLNTDTAVAQLTGNISGSTRPRVNLSDVRNIEVPLPNLMEQQRIVSILDKAFVAIDKAKANAELNLKKTKEFFESCLQSIFANEGDDWEEKSFGEVYDVRDGTHDSPKYHPAGYPLITSKNLKNGEILFDKINYISELDYININKRSKVDKGDILFAMIGTIGNPVVVQIEPNFAIKNVALFKVPQTQNSFFLKYLLDSKQIKDKFIEDAKGTTQKFVGLGYLREFSISLPSLKAQRFIVHKLDALSEETKRLEAIYKKKIEDLEELKRSILQKAFAGELTTGRIIPFQKIEGITATDLQAGITALALQKHLKQNQEDTFHHVKAEKIVHLAEYILNVDLERNPVKDAAGPNDFPRAKFVESRAKKAGFYTVFKNGEYFDYRQGNKINSVIFKAKNCLGEKSDILSQIIDILIPMTTQQAEIVTTVYAAWNNLILSGNQFTDDEIVTEARENWHEEKLLIPKEKFFNAIEWMRKKEIFIPKGNGKIVRAK